MKDILYCDLFALVEFMYMGEVKVKHRELQSFLRTAEVLRVRGLTESSSSKLQTIHLVETDFDNPSLPTVPISNVCSLLKNSLSGNELLSTQVLILVQKFSFQ